VLESPLLMSRRLFAGLVLAVVMTVGWFLSDRGYGRGLWYPSVVSLAGGQSHDQVLARLGPRHRAPLRAGVVEIGGTYPPDRLRLVGLKREGVLEVWIPVDRGWRRLRTYPILAASGGPGPKTRQGDLQVPEGTYRLTSFNPNSSYHLSIRVDYPNRHDRVAAAAEGRTNLGGDIYIHGRAVSIGCLAIGDAAIEELYLLLAEVGLSRSQIILAPSSDPQAPRGAPRWIADLYERIRSDLRSVRGT
jgi:hypothetical protein